MGNVTLDVVLIVAEIVVFLSLAGCTVWLASRSLPAGLDARQKRIEAISAELSSQVAAIVDERAAWKAQGERLAEEVSTYLEQIERKRSSTAAAASRIAAVREPGPPDIGSMSRAEQIAHVRSVMGG